MAGRLNVRQAGPSCSLPEGSSRSLPEAKKSQWLIFAIRRLVIILIICSSSAFSSQSIVASFNIIPHRKDIFPNIICLGFLLRAFLFEYPLNNCDSCVSIYCSLG